MATNGTWINTASGGLWSNSANWSGGIIASGTDAVADFSALDLNADNTVHLDGARLIGTLSFGDTSPSNNWLIDNNGVAANDIGLSVSSGTPTINVIDQTATIGVVLFGSQGFARNGGGTLVLAAANGVSGNVINLSGGTIQLANQNALQFANLNMSGGGLQFSPSIGTFVVSGLSGSGFSLADTAGAPIAFQVGNNTSGTYSGVLSGPGSLVKVGSNTLTLSGANTYTGTTTISNGVLNLTTPSAVQDSTVVVNVNGGLQATDGATLGGLSGPGSFSLSGGLQIGFNNTDTTYTGAMSGGGSLTKIGNGTLTLRACLQIRVLHAPAGVT